jgi:hypothetical protein
MKVQQALSQEREAVLGDSKSVLVTKTNAEIDAWVEANVTNLAQARNLFKQILKMQRNILRHASRLRDA